MIILSHRKSMILLGNTLRSYNTVTYKKCPNWVIMAIPGQYWVILDLMGLLNQKTDFNYFIESTSVIKLSLNIRNDNTVT